MGPLRGREPELASLERLLDSALAGEGGVALVEGPPGIGKTRVLEEVARCASERGLAVAVGRADELDQITPWGALVGALSAPEPPIISTADLAALGGMLDRRLEVLEQIRIGLERAAGSRPLLVVIDDLHWADPSTLVALGSLAVQLFSYPIVWLLGRRTFPSSSQMEALLERLAAQDLLRLPLESLGAQAAATLAADLLGRPADGTLEHLIDRAEGNPLYIVELMRMAGEAPSTAPIPDAEPDVGRALGSTVANHLRALSEPARRLIRVASVLGPSFSVVELSATTGEPAGMLLAPLEEALTAGVLIDDGSRVAFAHDLFRQAVYSDLPQALRLALHRDAARVLRATGAPALRVASHLMIGAAPGEVSALEPLGEAVGELFGSSPTAAADLALRMLELVGRDDSRRPTLVSTAVQLLGWSGRVEEARALGEAYLAEHELPVTVEAEIQLGIRRAWVMATSRPYPARLARHLTTDELIPAPVRANLITFEQDTAIFDRPAEEVRAALTVAAGLVAGDADGSDLAVVQSVRLSLEQEHGRLLDALAAAEASLAGVDHPSERARAIAHSSVASCLATLGRLHDALDALARALGEASSSGHTIIVSRCQSIRAMALLELGRVDDARAEATAAAELAENLGFGYYLGQALVTYVEAALRQGDLDDARAATARLSTRSPSEPTGDADWARALCADAGGDHPTAREALTPLIARLRRDGFVAAAWYPSRLAQLTALALRSGDREGAAVIAGAAGELARRNRGVPATSASALHARGLVEVDPSVLREAVRVLSEGERPLATAAAREDLARTLGGPAAREERVQELEAAYATYVECSAARDVARVRAALRPLGVRKRQPTVARPETGWESLTKSERVVVDRVARGLTNREVAAELFLSPDTINAHLRHAFRKLGIRSRVQLARLAGERERERALARERTSV